LLEDVGLGAYSGYYPSELSGGMRQRVAMARSFAYGSETLYLDEPFQGLDLELKLSLFDAFRALISAAGSGPTVVFVTHDVTEACLLGNRIYVLSHRPAVVRHRLENPVGPSDRSLHNPAVRDVEGALYDVILSASGHG
ncbi:ATP-binding cassette domain-containing protein, partial [Salinispira pacifica]